MTTQPSPSLVVRPPVRHALDAATPVLFLPVNIETRFMDVADGKSELWIRIYPDQIAIDSHEPELTDQEITDGKSYWDAVWRAGKPPASEDELKASWRGLASRYGSSRAAWIALTMTPTNIAQQPAAATAEGVDPVPKPTYPQPPQRNSAWEKPAVARALPDSWTVVTVPPTGTAPLRSTPVIAELAVGLTPGAGAPPPGSPVDEGLKWLVDFDAALNAGMALKIPLTAVERQRGFDRIFVYGLRTQDASGSDTCSALLDAHHYTDGFSLIAQGAPTNNTPDVDSAYSRKDVDYEGSFAVERQDPLTTDTACDGNSFAHLVGIAASHLEHVALANGFAARNGTDMLTALWPATLGYFLSQMMADVFTPAQVEIARQYILANVLPRGPIPAFSVGATPYGVLPITSLQRYPQEPPREAGSIEPALVTLVQRLWPTWLASSDTAPHMQKTGDPDQELLTVLGMDASSMAFRGREVLGDNFLWNYASFRGIPQNAFANWWQEHLIRGRAVLDKFKYTQLDPRLIHLGMSNTSFPVNVPTVQSGPLSETDGLKADADVAGQKLNYIQWLRSASLADIQAENYPGTKPTSLLYKILRQSVLLDNAALASGAEVNAGRLQVEQIRESEIIGVEPATSSIAAASGGSLPKVSPWEILARPSLPNPTLSWADYLGALDPPPESPFARLAELRASMDRLSGLSTAELDRLLTETLDACSHRVDVWATAIATAMLHRKRSQQIQGMHVGAFGWVEEVRAAATRAPVQGSELQRVRLLDQSRARLLNTPVNLPPPVEPMQDNGGFIFAPSLAQASVAAVLRNGYMTHKSTEEEGLLSVDLSSERVRRALWLLEGVQQGQSLNALLGYLFESGLHILRLDKYAQPFRDKFPIVANKLTPSDNPSESVAASNVVDGVALRTAFDNNQLRVGDNWGPGLPNADPDQSLVISVLRQIDDYADALADLSISEAVFQIIRGNFGRAGTLMDAISKGTRPPDPDVIHTPRGGLDLTHRIMLLCAGDPEQNPAWSGVTQHSRAATEPSLDAWLSQLLPDPAMVICEVSFDAGAGNQTREVSLLDLDVGPLDVIAMADASDIPQRGELENRILLRAAVPAAATNVQIDFHPAGLAPGSVSFPDTFFLAKALRSLISSARALSPQDLTVPEKKAEDTGGAVDATELRDRAKALRTSLHDDLQGLIAAAAQLPGNPAASRAALMDCSFYGVPGCIPKTSTGVDPDLVLQTASVGKILQGRMTQASAVNIDTAAMADLLGVFTTILGNDFVALPRFTPPDFVSLQSAFAQSAALVATDPQAPSRWFMQLTHIRPGIFRLDTALNLASILSDGAPHLPDLLLGQLPVKASDRWLGLTLDPANPPSKGRVALACITQGDPLNQNSYAGLMLDEWPERIPTTKETAAVAFHYQEPHARAPQALLLAVCPDGRKTWDDDLVTGILQEALELAKIRTVDLDSVQDVGQILPALYFAFNVKGATISANFAEAQRAIAIVR